MVIFFYRQNALDIPRVQHVSEGRAWNHRQCWHVCSAPPPTAATSPAEPWPGTQPAAETWATAWSPFSKIFWSQVAPWCPEKVFQMPNHKDMNLHCLQQINTRNKVHNTLKIFSPAHFVICTFGLLRFLLSLQTAQRGHYCIATFQSRLLSFPSHWWRKGGCLLPQQPTRRNTLFACLILLHSQLALHVTLHFWMKNVPWYAAWDSIWLHANHRKTEEGGQCLIFILMSNILASRYHPVFSNAGQLRSVACQ